MSKYRDYFSIDENYFPQVNEEVLNSGAVDWRKFYPHETFIKLLKDIESVLSRTQRLSVWVEGAYGTGKSHAALTLKKLLDASEDETKAYFEKYGLSNDLCNKIQGAKKQGKILTVHRYGASLIKNDRDLIMAIQESIKSALEKSGAEYMGEDSLKDSVINWLSDSANKNYFNALIVRDYSSLFDGDNVDTIINKLSTYNDQDVIKLIGNIFKVADEVGITALKLDIPGLITWIKKIISSNNLKAIVFIWDEFTEYFLNNMNSLTGFQQLIELSATSAFYFVIVTHKSEGLFHDTNSDKKKILDRFIKPTCNIELPENMAFKLMGAAMEKKDDPAYLEHWQIYADDLNNRLHDSRKLVMESAKITEDELKAILPIHPFTALLLKHLSSAFDSNQRSMFDFIKNNRGEDVKGFQWYIDNHGPLDNSYFILTIDMLWDFFYEKGKEHLAPNIRNILDSYGRQNIALLDEEHQRVLKTILLLQAISQKVGDRVELFIANEKNINHAFDGTELEGGQATRIAEKLVREEILYKKPTGINKFQYSAIINAGDTTVITKQKEEFMKNKKTQDLVAEGQLSDVLNLSGALNLRYVVKTATADNFKRVINELINQQSKYENNILAVVAYAKDESESYSIKKMIKEACQNDEIGMIFIDTSLSYLGSDGFEQYCENMANSSYQRGKDNALANQFDTLAKDVLKKWKDKIVSGEFFLYCKDKSVDGERITNFDELLKELKEYNRKKYPDGIENYKVIENMFAMTSIGQGALCGAEEKIAGTFRSGNEATKLETALSGAWGIENYWTKSPTKTISKIKIAVENEINQAFDAEGKVAISQIYDLLKKAPFGFMPCNLTAFILGFILKDYANDTYRWSDGQVSDNMSPIKLKEMIEEIIKLQVTPNNRYKEKYIVTMTEEERAFSAVTSKVFGIPENQCASIEQTRDRVRSKMKELAFPIWCVKEILETESLSVTNIIIEELIISYWGLANSNNLSSKTSEMNIALNIGKLCLANPTASDDLARLITKEYCKKGMVSYLGKYQEGNLIKLANEIGDNGEYINTLKTKFDADAANWVWNIDTANKKIDELIVEYSIILESNKINTKTYSFVEMTSEWCDKLNLIRLSYEAIKNDVDEVKTILEMLWQIKKTGIISDSQKGPFLEQLKINLHSFKNFWQSQNEIFSRVCSFWLEGLSAEQIDDVFKQIHTGVFTRSKSEYLQIVEDEVNAYKRNLGKTKLRNLWYEKTNTTTPRVWSTTYQTPLMCMIDKDEDRAKNAFATINRNNPDDIEIKKAIEFLEQTDIFNNLNSSENRDKCFMEKVVKNYSAVLTDINEIRKHLSERITSEPYDWYPSVEVERKIKAFAEARYNSGGSDKALRKIEEMSPEKLKNYLKQLIKDNIVVGMEIINDK